MRIAFPDKQREWIGVNNDDLEILGLSSAACRELRKCNINTVRDLMLLINSKLVNDNPGTGLRYAILAILRNNPNRNYDCVELKKTLYTEYGNVAPTSVETIRILLRRLENEGIIRSASSGLYYYPSDKPPIITPPTTLKEAILEIVKTLNGEFDYKIIRDKLRQKYGSNISSAKSSIQIQLRSLLAEGIIERSETGDYICHSGKTKAPSLDSFLRIHIGKEVEIKYKTQRPSSANKWRRVTIWAYDDNYLYITKQYSSGHHISFLKKQIVDYRSLY